MKGKLRIWFGNFFECRNGTAAVEFALLSPLYILLLMGLLAYGIYIAAAHSVQQIAADAARIAVGGIDNAERQKLVTDFVSGHSQGYAFVEPNKLSVAVSQATAGDEYFVVTLTYDAADLPIWQLASDLPLPQTAIVRQSVVRIGGL
ncbi:pilus assembly protein [Tianweitania sp. BSSL-BM11]|uniref:Pilus assembly protein n=1 Tax=Tianweitania aestuarii TaxID=2814886 RepID=A0ABS5RS67_9HYPH|nr:TadE/TadG family type IV pilus assembly protein [Tianweitania aestuarii]MBS9719824.1 pilus assembly protein [Tianweitania aestuarii]